MFCKTLEICSTYKDSWGRIRCMINDDKQYDVVGKWLCEPQYIPINTIFTCNLVQTKFKNKQNYTISGDTSPTDPERFVILHQLLKNGISHLIVTSLEQNYTQLHTLFESNMHNEEIFKDMNVIDSQTVKEVYRNNRKLILLQIKFPFITSSQCLELFTDEVIDNIEERPYILTIYNQQKNALQIADKIAKFQQFDSKLQERIQAYCKYVIKTLFHAEKHYWFSPSKVAEDLISFLASNEWPTKLSTDEALNVIRLSCEQDPLPEKGDIALAECCKEERFLAFEVCKVLQNDKECDLNMDDAIDNTLDCEQQYAVKMSLKSSLIITGKAGTGKTKVIKEIVRLMETMNLPIRLCAPTGKAAVRMSEGVGVKATTIHFAIASAQNNSTPNGEIVIIDEASMLSPNLLLKLLRSIRIFRLIFVGDDNQLASIDPGCLLKDLIKSNIFEICTLRTIHRQRNGSVLAQKSHDIINGSARNWKAHSCDAFCLQFCTDPLKHAINQTKLLSGRENVQLLVLTKKSAAYANIALQDTFNPSLSNANFIERANKAPWKQNDKIIATENYYEGGELIVCNGSIGLLHHVDSKTKKVKGTFDHVKRIFTAGTTEIDHAYALTLHKYQGSEIDCIVFCLDYVPNMASKEAIYTACTRGKKQVFIFCDEHIWKTGCQKNENLRNTRLAHYLSQQLHKKIKS